MRWAGPPPLLCRSGATSGADTSVSASTSPSAALAGVDAMTVLTLVSKSCYRDSVVLLTLARALRAGAGVSEVAALMATDANKALMAHSALLTPEASGGRPQ